LSDSGRHASGESEARRTAPSDRTTSRCRSARLDGVLSLSLVVVLAVSCLLVACAAIDWNTRVTSFGEKGSPPDLKLWVVFRKDHRVGNGLVVALAVAASLIACRALRRRDNPAAIECARCRYPAGRDSRCSECGGQVFIEKSLKVRLVRMSHATALLGAIVLSVGSDDMVTSAFAPVSRDNVWVADSASWPLGVGMSVGWASAVWCGIALLCAFPYIARWRLIVGTTDDSI